MLTDRQFFACILFAGVAAALLGIGVGGLIEWARAGW